MIVSIAAAVVVLGVLLLLHELGHFLVAKRAGVGVLQFSIGFGPKIFGKRVGDTDYVVGVIPFGALVAMVAEQPDRTLSPAEQRVAFNNQPLWKLAAIILAGPAANLLFAFIAFSAV